VQKRVFVYNASPKAHGSSCQRIIDEILDSLEQKTPFHFLVTKRSPNNTSISTCRSCLNCFNGYECNLFDDLSQVKKEIENSDIVILATPVYAHNVTGNLKNLIDRICYWTHIMHLKGRLGICIVTSSSNGEKYVAEYLKKIMEYMGLLVIDTIAIPIDVYSEDAVCSILETKKNSICKKITNSHFLASPQQEKFYSDQKKAVKSQPPGSFEKEYWKNHGYFELNTFMQVFRKYYNNKHSL